MALIKFIKDMSIISALDDEPNDIGGLTAAELKEKFDEGGLAVKSYINENMVPQINSLITETETISEKLTIYARLVVGTSASGITSSECDYLCDGVNDQEEINAAIAALPANGGEIVILDGTYNITAKINVNKSNVSIRGNGDATVLKRMWNSGRSEGVITLTSVSGCKIKNLQIDGNKTTHTSLENEGIYLHSSDNNTIMGNVCINNGSYGIYLKSSNINVIRNNFCNADTYGGVYLYAGYGNIITSNICDSNGLYYGIYLFYGGYNTIAGNSCNNNGGGIYLKTSTNNAVAGNVCNDNDLEGVYLDSGSSNTITGNTCSNNGVGVAFGSCKNNAINGNACNDNNTAIRLEDSHSNTISGNSCIRGGGKETDYSEDQYTIKFAYTNNNNIISSNNCAGKDVVLGDGTGNKLLSAILDGKVDRTTTVNGHALSDDITVTKSDVGLGDCDNTSDVDKPVSTAQQAELDKKVDKTSVIDDLTTGGVTKALSAEQGKALNTSISELADDHKLKVASIEKELNDYQKVMAGVNVNNEPKQTVTGYGVISLPKNAANGQVSVSVFGNTETDEEGNTKSTIGASRLKNVGKNLLTSTFKATNIGLNVENISDSSFKVNNGAYQGKKWKIKVNPGETYTFSAKQKDYTHIGVFFEYIDVATNKSFYTANKGETDSFKHTATIPNGVNEVYLDLRTSLTPTNKTFYDLQFERGSIATPYEPYTESTQYLPNIGELRSLPNGTKDEIRNGQHIQRIGVKTSVASGTVVNYTNMVTGGQFVAYLVDSTQQVGVKGDTLIALATQLTYQLAEPIVTPIEVSGTLLSYPSGTVYIEKAIADAGIYSDKIVVLNQNLPIAVLETLSKIDFATGLETPLDVLTGTIAADGLSFTHPDLTEGDIVFFTYFYDKESTEGELTVEYYDSRYVLKDSVTGKYYKVVQSVADGELTQTLVEV